MNVKKKIIIIAFIVFYIIYAVVVISDHRRKPADAGEPARQIDSLDREYRERERSLEANLGELAGLSEDAIAALDGAGAVVERTGIELRAAAGNLREAKRILGDLAIQMQNLQSELDNCRTSLYRIRSLAGVETGGELSGEDAKK
jgi:hypothetical protein